MNNNLLKNSVMVLCFMLIKVICVAETTCFLAVENQQIIKKEGDCKRRLPPCSTFKIAASLMGYDACILANETAPTWDYQDGYPDWLETWKVPHNPSLWMSNSCVWFTQEITKRLGLKDFSAYVNKLDYGNKDVSGDKGKNNGLTNCWLSSSLEISAEEQVAFLKKLIHEELPVSIHAQKMTKNIIFLQDLQDGWKLYGKTGSGSHLSADRRIKLDKQIGWFVGFLQKNERFITFAYWIADSEPKDTYASVQAKASALEELKKILDCDK
jgi:beta-lactamase class D